MAHKIEENKNMAPSSPLREEDNSSEDDNQLKQDENNRAVGKRRVKSRTPTQRASRRLNQLRAKQKKLKEKQQSLVNKLRVLKNLILTIAAEASQIDLPKPVLN